MKRFIISAAAAGLILAAGASLAPAQAAPLPSGVARSVIDDQGAVEQARWVRCWRPDGWRGHGWGWRGHGWGHWRHGTVGVIATAAGVIMARPRTFPSRRTWPWTRTWRSSSLTSRLRPVVTSTKEFT